MDNSRKRKRSVSEDLPSLCREGISTGREPQIPQPVSIGLRQPASYEHSSTWMAGQSQAHFGDIYHISDAASANKVEGQLQTRDTYFTSWLTDIISTTWNRRERAKALRNRLGEWAREAQSPSGDYLSPVLSRAAFEKHLIDHNATFEPSTLSTSSFAWAQLLHAFDIRPGQSIVFWQPTKPEEDPLMSGILSLAVDGQSLCHILNLYRHNPRRDSPRLSAVPGSVLHATTKSGRLSIHVGAKNESTVVHYKAKPSATPHIIFPTELRKDDLMKHYLRALHDGTSDDRLSLPHFNEPLDDRIGALARIAELIHTKALKDERPMVNNWWLEQASRIKRRVTTNGGEDRLLEEGLLKLLAMKVTPPADYEYTMVRLVKDLVMYEDQAFETMDESDISMDLIRAKLKREINGKTSLVIEELVEQTKETWIANLANTVSDVTKILNMPSMIDTRLIKLLVFDTDNWLWESSCYIQG